VTAAHIAPTAGQLRHAWRPCRGSLPTWSPGSRHDGHLAVESRPRRGHQRPGLPGRPSGRPAVGSRLRLVGELDLASALLLTAAGLVLAGEGELISGLAVRVDLSELSFLDSSGLTALNDVAVLLTRAGATGVTLTHATGPVLLLLILASAAGHIGRASTARSSPPPVLPACADSSNQGPDLHEPGSSPLRGLNQPDLLNASRLPRGHSGATLVSHTAGAVSGGLLQGSGESAKPFVEPDLRLVGEVSPGGADVEPVRCS